MSEPLTITQLITDESFISYCLKNNDEDASIWEDYLVCHPGEKNNVRKAREEVLRLHHALIAIEQQKGLEQLKAKVHALGKTSNGSKILPIYPLRKKAWIAIAATFLLIGFAVFWYQSRFEAPVTSTHEHASEYFTTVGERRKITLGDGTHIDLNAASRLRISPDFNTDSRTVYLEGEAFFEVAKDTSKPFIIHVETMDIRVLGTVFNVKAYQNDAVSQAALIEGSIEVTLKKEGNKKVYLKPLDKIAVTKKENTFTQEEKTAVPDVDEFKVSRIEKIAEQTPVEISWLENKLTFNRETFSQIAMSLERWYDVRFIFEDESKKKLTFQASFRNNEKLEEILLSLQQVEPFAYRREGKTIYIN